MEASPPRTARAQGTAVDTDRENDDGEREYHDGDGGDGD
jgi:hypothetical protein